MPENSEPGPSTPGSASDDSTQSQTSPSDTTPTASPTPTTSPTPPVLKPGPIPPYPAPIPTLPPRLRWWTWYESNVIFPRTTLLVVAAMGIVGAVCWRIDETGIGTTLTGIAALAAVLATAPADFRTRNSPYWVVITVGILGLVAVPTFRDADWVSALCIVAAIAAGAVLFVEAHGLRGLWLAALSPLFAPVAGFAALFRRPPKPPRPDARQHSALILFVAVTTILLLIVFGALFASADATFGSLFDFDLTNPVGPDLAAALIAGVVIALFTLGGAFLTAQGTRYPSRPERDLPPPWAWAVPVGALLAMFVLFLGVQATAMFGGDDFVQKTAGLTYSQYAVQGFWQLLVVGILVIGVAIIAWYFVDVDDPRSRISARVLLGGLCVATLAVGASAIHRMTRYINAYGMTEDRIFGIFVELLVGMVMIGFLVAGARMNIAGLTRTLVALGIFATLGFALFNPERYIAHYNVERYESTGKVDAYFLGGLSADAASQFDRLPTDLRKCAEWRYAQKPDNQSWREFSFARHTPAAPTIDDRSYYQTNCSIHRGYR
ncbi:DUF4153 domain-containing protein [Gordonia sp. CPCC 205333]|uniref:DUF4153 domain-containing protein n=1 Tax=Gordonia sp. CPCC 205333 TaxID=3140790 RepID=UPI003AF3C046